MLVLIVHEYAAPVLVKQLKQQAEAAKLSPQDNSIYNSLEVKHNIILTNSLYDFHQLLPFIFPGRESEDILYCFSISFLVLL